MVNKEDYTLRISSATPVQLVVINYELIVDFLNDTLTAFGEDHAIENKAAFEQHVEQAKNGLTQLISALDFEISISHDLYRLYVYVNQLLNTAFFSYNRDSVAEALSIMQSLLTGWEEAAKNDDAQPTIENAPQVYAGLTYQKEGLSEFIMQDDNRGYQA